MRPLYEVADVIRRFLPQMDQNKVLAHHSKTLSALQRCRTADLGGHVDACDQCGHLHLSYNSCRNRHCPKCQGLNKEMWIVRQEDMLLPVAYFHVVFTLPHELNGLCLHRPKFMYGLLFRAAWHTLNTLSSDPRWIGAKTAATMVLHTWSQTMVLHPHVHCIVPNGGLAKNGTWQFPKRGKANFLFPVAAMKKLFKGYFLDQLKKAVKKGGLPLPANFPIGKNYRAWTGALYQKEWVAYTKRPFSGVKKVVSYLARYSHRVAITNHRIKGIADGKVAFLYKDYRDGAKKKMMALHGIEFLRRFCLHILPKGFRKVRQYGFLSNAGKSKNLDRARLALGGKVKNLLTKKERKAEATERMFGDRTGQCPCCKKGKLVTSLSWERNKSPPFLKTVIKLKV